MDSQEVRQRQVRTDGQTTSSEHITSVCIEDPFSSNLPVILLTDILRCCVNTQVK